jgi:branched-chain amino acid transport system substrate-binding protein
MHTRGGRSPWVVAASIAVALVACSSSAADRSPDTIPTAPPTSPPPVDDGVLQVGVLLPANGEGASLGESARAAIRVAVTLANNATGGVLGHEVQLVMRNEGADAVAAQSALQQLVDAQVDVIIGPASSNTAIALAPSIVDAGIAACSPSASALALDDFPDNGLLFRTIPSDSLEADAMASVIEQTGETSVAIVYVDDGYGRPFEKALRDALRRRGVSVDDSLGYAVDDDEFDTEADRVVNAGRGALAVIGDPDAGSRMLAAIAEQLRPQPARDIVVNDALRRPWTIGLLNAMAKTKARVRGVSPQVSPRSDELLELVQIRDSAATGLFATQAYDCVNLFMLAAELAGSTQPSEIAARVPGISSGGSRCTSFAACSELLAEARNIDYDSPGEMLTIGPSGDLTLGVYDEFEFDDTGRDVSMDSVIVSSS